MDSGGETLDSFYLKDDSGAIRVRSVSGYRNAEIGTSSKSDLSFVPRYDFANRATCSSVGQNVVSFIPSGWNSRRSRKSGNDCPETRSTIRAAVLMPDWQ